MVTGITWSGEEEQLLIRIGSLQMGKGRWGCTRDGGGGNANMDRCRVSTTGNKQTVSGMLAAPGSLSRLRPASWLVSWAPPDFLLLSLRIPLGTSPGSPQCFLKVKAGAKMWVKAACESTKKLETRVLFALTDERLQEVLLQLGLAWPLAWRCSPGVLPMWRTRVCMLWLEGQCQCWFPYHQTSWLS